MNSHFISTIIIPTTFRQQQAGWSQATWPALQKDESGLILMRDATHVRVPNHRPALQTRTRVGQTSTLPILLPSNEITAIVHIYPNPANNRVVAELLNKDDIFDLLELYNAVGKLVLSKKCSSKSEEMDVSLFVEGLYMIRVVTIGGHTDTKIFSIIK